jgi:hypothetical protein
MFSSMSENARDLGHPAPSKHLNLADRSCIISVLGLSSPQLVSLEAIEFKNMAAEREP